jgi:hypothetical protein
MCPCADSDHDAEIESSYVSPGRLAEDSIEGTTLTGSLIISCPVRPPFPPPGVDFALDIAPDQADDIAHQLNQAIGGENERAKVRRRAQPPR